MIKKLHLLFTLIFMSLLGGGFAAAQPTYFYPGTTGNDNVIPFGFAGIADKAQWLYTPTEWNVPPLSGNISKVYFKIVNSVASTTFTNLTIKLSLPGITNLPAGATPWLPATTVYSATTTFTGIVGGNWISVTLSTPFFYSGTVPLLVDVQQGGYTAGLTIPQGNLVGSTRRMYGLLANPNSTGSDPTLAAFGFDIVPACTGTPTAPTITTPAQTQPICTSGTFTISASSTGGPGGTTYQWEQSASAGGPWVNVTGGTGATTLSYTTATLSSNTYYRLKAICGLPTNAAFSAPYLVTVGALAPGAIVGPDTIACPQNTQLYTAAAAFGTNFYTWTLPAGWSGSSTTNSITVTPGLSNGTISVTATSACGVSTASTKAVKVIQNPSLYPNATITYDEALKFCEGGGVVLTANQQPGTGLTYQWYKNGAPLPAADSFSYIAAGSGTYAVFETNRYGCRDTSDPLDVTTYPKPLPVITRNNLTLSTGNYVSYQWWYNGAPVPGGSGPSTLMKANGIYYVVVTDANGCENRSEAYFLGNLAVFSTGIASSDVRVFPNPVSDVLNIEAPASVNAFIRSADGRLLLHSIGGKKIDVSSLPAGMYTVLITDRAGATVKTEKLIKSK